MGFVYWLPDADGDWDTASDWSGGVLPTSNDTVTISTTDIHTISHSTGDDFAASLSVGNDIFSMTGGSLAVVGAMSVANAFTMSNGSITVGSSASITNSFTLDGGVMTVASISVSGSFTQYGGSLVAAGAISIGGAAQLQGGYLGGGATLKVGGTIVISNYAIGGNALISNSKTIDQTGNLTLGDSTGIGVTVTNQAGGTYVIANAVTIAQGAASAQFANAGALTVLAGVGTSTIDVSAGNTGTISVGASSALVFAGALTSLGGTITGAGTLALGSGSTTLAAGTSVGVAQFGVQGNGTTLTLAGNVALAGGYYQSGYSDVVLGGFSLTIAGAAQFQQNGGSPDINGSGTLVTKGTTTISNSNPGLIIGGSVAWDNYGTVLQSSYLQLGDSNGAVASATNELGGVFEIATTNNRITNGSTPGSTFTNAGTLWMTASGGTSYVGVNVTSTGVITAALNGNLEFDGATNSVSGSIGGAGQVSFGAGSSTIAAGTTITVGTLAVYGNGTAVTLGGNATVSGGFLQYYNSDVALGGHVLTLLGTAQFEQYGGSPDINGSGTLVTKGTTTIFNGNPGLTIGGSVAWDNYGTVLQTNYLQIGDSNGAAASVTNEVGGVFNVVATNNRITSGSTSASSFANAGTLEMTASGGTSYVGVNVTSTGVITDALNGNLEFDGQTNSVSGSITGAGQVSFGGGSSSTIAAGTTITVATLAVYGNGTTVTLGGNVTVSGGFLQYYNSDVALGGHVLTILGAAQFEDYSGSPDINGSGTLVTKGTTTIFNGNPGLIVGGSVAWDNYGTVLQSSYLQIGDSNGAAASVTNEVGGVFDITTTNNRITDGSTPASSFTNAGTLAMIASGGTSYVVVNLASTGLITAALTGNLEFDGATNSVSGSLTGAGQVSFGGGGSTTIAGGTTITVGTLAVYGNGTTVTLGGNVTVSGGFLQYYNSDVALGGHVLTILGAAQFEQYGGSPDINGTGTLVTKGTTTIFNGNPGLIIGGSVAWDNYGTVLQTNYLQIGDSNGAAASVTNEVGGVFEIATINNRITSGSTPVSSFTNAGTLAMIASGGISYVGVNVTSTGVITAALNSNLEFDGATNSVSGSIGGAGQVSFGAGSTTIAAGTTITVGTLAVYGNGTAVTLGGNVTVSGGFSQRDGSVLSLGAYTLTLTGAAAFQQYSGAPVITGTGTLITKGLTTLVSGGTALTVGGSAAWNNYGTVLESGSLQIGNSSTTASSLVNQAGGVLDIIAGNVGISNGSTPASTITNAGTLEMTAIGGSSSLNLNVTNTGTILAQGGTLSVTGALSGASGVIAVGGGGSVGFAAAVASTQTVKFLDAQSSISVTLTSPTSFAATISGFVKGDTIDLTNVTNATAVFSGGALTFTDNTTHLTDAVLHFTGTPNFTFASDGRGGTLIGDPPISSAALGLTTRMYFTNSGSKTETIAVTGKTEEMIGNFSYAHPDVLDLSKLIAGTPAAHDLRNIGHYLTASSSGGDTKLLFDPSGHGHGSAVALLSNVTTTTIDALMAHHALNLG